MRKKYRLHDVVHVTIHNLRALLFWATIGVSKSEGGQYADIEESESNPGILKSNADHIGYKLPKKPRFRVANTRFKGDKDSLGCICSNCGWQLGVHAGFGDFSCPEPSPRCAAAWTKRGFGKAK